MVTGGHAPQRRTRGGLASPVIACTAIAMLLIVTLPHVTASSGPDTATDTAASEPHSSARMLTSSNYGECQTTTNNVKAAQYSWVIAVVVSIGGALISNVGVNLQKMAHTRKQQGARPSMYRAMWVIGFLGIVGGAIGDFVALGFGAESVVAPLGSMTLVSNVILAPLLLKEVISRSDLFATALIVAGCVLAVAFASHKDCLYSLESLFDLYKTIAFAAYAATITSVVLIWLVVIRWMERRLLVFGEHHPKYQAVFKFHRFSYAAISGIVGSQSILFAKTSVELVMDSARGGQLFLLHPASYAILLSMGATVTLQIYWLNCGLARWDALYNVPVFQSFWILVSVVGGGVFYREFNGFDVLQWCMFPAGVILTVVGVVLLSQRDSSKAKEAATARQSSTANVGLLAEEAAAQRPVPEEIQCRFNERMLGLKLRPAAIRIVLNPKFPTVKTVVNAWIVVGLVPGSAVQRSGTVQVNDVVSAVNGDSVLVHRMTLANVMKRLKHLPRPVKITFLRPPPRRRTSSVTGQQAVAALHSPGTGSGAGQSSSVPIAPARQPSRMRAPTGESLEMLAVHSEAAGVEYSAADGMYSDDDEPLEITMPSRPQVSIRHSHRSLQHLSLDPLAAAFHTGQMIAPTVIDKDEVHDDGDHPLVRLMDTVFPDNGISTQVVDRLVDVVDPDGDGVVAGSMGAARRSMSSMITFLSPSRPRRGSSTPLAASGGTHISHGAMQAAAAAPARPASASDGMILEEGGYGRGAVTPVQTRGHLSGGLATVVQSPAVQEEGDSEGSEAEESAAGGEDAV